LGPWLERPTDADLAVVAEIVAGTAPFSFKLAEIVTFPDGLVYLDPEPSEPFAALTSRLADAFPACPPYGGAFASVVPHLTLDQLSADISVASVRASLGAAIPTLAHADRLDLQWWENDRCHLMGSWSLGG
ncbi:MAG: 2'-5' RNA ligase family protein, partial [Marmoricola sp.]